MMNKTAKRIFLVVIVAAVVALGIWGFLAGRAEIAAEQQRDRPIQTPPRVTRDAEGKNIVTFDKETQERVGLKSEALAAVSMQPEIVAYGSLQEDPSQSFTLRSPFNGTLRQSPDHGWPKLGDVVPDSFVVGLIEPRLTPTDRVDLASKLAAARADIEASTAVLAQDRASFDRLKTLNSEEKSVSDRALQEADAKVKGDEARLKAATDTAALIAAASEGTSSSTRGDLPLVSSQGGQVVEVSASSGENIESGQAILRVARFDALIVSVTVSLGEQIDPAVEWGRIVVAGHEDRPIKASRVGLAGNVDPKTLGQTFLFRISENNVGLRPGMAVSAYLPRTKVAAQGVLIPVSAVVHEAGKAWAYVQTGDDKYVRQEISDALPADKGFFVTTGIVAGQRIVTVGAATLLSEELKSQIQIGD